MQQNWKITLNFRCENQPLAFSSIFSNSVFYNDDEPNEDNAGLQLLSLDNMPDTVTHAYQALTRVFLSTTL